jgi:hypothetical protein
MYAPIRSHNMVHDFTYDPNYLNFQFFFVCPFVGCSTKEGGGGGGQQFKANNYRYVWEKEALYSSRMYRFYAFHISSRAYLSSISVDNTRQRRCLSLWHTLLDWERFESGVPFSIFRQSSLRLDFKCLCSYKDKNWPKNMGSKLGNFL